jgi:hypothetical protein
MPVGFATIIQHDGCFGTKAAIYLADRLSSSCASGWDDDSASPCDSAEFDAGRMFKRLQHGTA